MMGPLWRVRRSVLGLYGGPCVVTAGFHPAGGHIILPVADLQGEVVQRSSRVLTVSIWATVLWLQVGGRARCTVLRRWVRK